MQDNIHMKSMPLSDTRVTFSAYEKRVQQTEREVRELIGLSEGLYVGPIEDIQPGDVIAWDRIEEYKLFMREKGIQVIKQWGFFEKWKDNGNRPFQELNITSSNPFEENP